MKKFLLGLLCVLLVAGITSTSSATSLLLNGSFETPELGGTSWAVFADLEDTWYALDGTAGIEIQRNTVTGAQDGEQYVELDSHYGGADSNSTMGQMVQLFAGTTYQLDFYYQARTTDQDDNGIEYGIIGIDKPMSLTVDVDDQAPGDWLAVSQTYTITEDNFYVVYFSAFGDNGIDGTSNTLGGFIDNVSLNPVPEPATMMLFGIGLLGLAGVSRKKMS